MFLKNKSRPAIKASEELTKISKEKRLVAKKARILEYQLKYYENLFPWLTDFKEDDIDEILIEHQVYIDNEDPARKWLSAAEYHKLPSSQKYQIALDRYKKNRKTNWQIGRDYERFIGYLYELEGYKVIYQGAIKGFEDHGRDVIAIKNNKAKVIQCKYWSKRKVIHEKHVFQLFGTKVAYEIDNPTQKVEGIFITSTELSTMAKAFAQKLNIDVLENKSLDDYPLIKCNVSKTDKSKIYHLPFDQQYDNVQIEAKYGESYTFTIEEAEQKGFRRANRWRKSTQ